MSNALFEVSRTMDTIIHPPLRQINKARKLVNVVPGEGIGELSVDWIELEAMSDAMIAYSFSTGAEDTVDFSLQNSKIPLIWKDFTLDRRLYEAMRRKNTNVDASAALEAAYTVSSAEEMMILRGITRNGTTFEKNGLYEGAGQDYSTPKAIGTYGGIQDAVTDVYEMMDDSDVPTDSLRWNLSMSPNIYNKVNKSRSANDVKEMKDLLELLGTPNNPGNVFKSNTLPSVSTTGSALLTPTPDTGSQYFDYYLSAEVQTELGQDGKHPRTGPISGRIFESGVLRIRKNAVIGKMTALSTAASV
ncbi:encapsulin [Methanosarcina acetivorans]|uniref:Uncharacterized protein n=1 Tax=Methanosarcina acetivorans (strain ATCC 35395 / DSM 2834 / JCM 12185 / C2A) TaxID=188937 RepID=Q8TJG8_METAC|nr:encapsulin [Methanosarcina acetivorans]AAM07167.1 predicted protein [Methanosarcina acetivorans C2A]